MICKACPQLDRKAIAFGSDEILCCHSGQASRPCPASESRNPVIRAVRAFTPAVDYWVPARARPVEPGSLGRDDSPYAITLGFAGDRRQGCVRLCPPVTEILPNLKHARHSILSKAAPVCVSDIEH